MQDIYKLMMSDGNTRYEIMTGKRAQQKNQKREESKLTNRWLPVELEDVPNDAEIRSVDGFGTKMINAGELKGEDEDAWADADIVNEGFSSSIASQPPTTTIQATEQTPPPPSQPTANPVPVDGEALAKAEATQTSSDAPKPVSVAPTADVDLPEGGWGGRNPAVNPVPDWCKGQPATMTDDDLLTVWMEYETDPRKDDGFDEDEWNYREDVREEYAERVKQGEKNKLAAADQRDRESIQQLNKAMADFTPPAIPTDEQVTDLTDVFVKEAKRRELLKADDSENNNRDLSRERLRTHQLVGTTRVVSMTRSEAKLLNATMDGEWVEAPELKQFAKPRKPEAGKGNFKGGKWHGVSGTNLLRLCGSEGLSAKVSRELVKRLTGLEASNSTVAVQLSKGRHDEDLPKIGRPAWAEFWHTAGEIHKELGLTASGEEKPTETEGKRNPLEEMPTGPAIVNTALGASDLLDEELTKRARFAEVVLSRYRLQISELLDRMTMDLQKALTD